MLTKNLRMLCGTAVLAAMAVLSQAARSTEVSVPMPPGDPIYRELRLADNLGLLADPLMGSQPLSRAEIFRLMQPLADGIEVGTGMIPLALDSSRGITASVSHRLSGARNSVNSWDVYWGKGVYPTTLSWQPLKLVSLRGSHILRDTDVQHRLDHGYNITEGLVLTRDGHLFVEGNWLAVNAAYRLRADRHALTFQPLVLNVRTGWKNIRLTYGQEPLWWGPGVRGSMLITTNARSLNQIRLESDSPWRLPGFLESLGKWQAGLFVSKMNDPHRGDFPDPWLTGLRVSYRPTSWFVLSGTRTIMLGGQGNEFVLTWDSFWNLVTGKNENKGAGAGNNNTDQKASLDASLYLWPVFRNIPVVEGGRFYVEIAGEDSPQTKFGPDVFLPSARGEMFGVELVARGALLRFEHAHSVDDKNLWYWHHLYRDGYTYRGRIMGHPMGGDSKSWTTQAEVPMGRRGLIAAGWERYRHGYEAEPGVPPSWVDPPVSTGTVDLYELAVEVYSGRWPGRFRVEGRLWDETGSLERIGPQEQWGVTLSMSR